MKKTTNRFLRNTICPIFFPVTPQTSEKRVRFVDSVSDEFIFMVSSASVTGAKGAFSEEQQHYFERIAQMNLRNPQIVGFGISNRQTFEQATQYAKGAIIGSACIKFLSENEVEKNRSVCEFSGWRNAINAKNNLLYNRANRAKPNDKKSEKFSWKFRF